MDVSLARKGIAEGSMGSTCTSAMVVMTAQTKQSASPISVSAEVSSGSLCNCWKAIKVSTSDTRGKAPRHASFFRFLLLPLKHHSCERNGASSIALGAFLVLLQVH